MNHHPLFPCLAAACFLSLASARAQNIALDLLDHFNIITGNYNAGNETEGSAFIYGNYLPQGSSARFGFNGGAASNDSQNVLWLNNGVGNTTSTTLLTGSVISRTSVNTGLFTLNGNAPGTPGITQGQAAWDSALTSLGSGTTVALTGILQSASIQWSQLAANSTGFIPGNGSFTFNATPTNIDGHMVAVFNVDAATLFGGNTYDRLEANFNGAETILINVSGTDITVGKNFSNGFQGNESKVLFNFYEATTLTINRNFRGGIFSPNANVIQGGSNFDGTLVSASFTQNAEVHDERFDGYLPYQIPEPSSAVLLIAGAGLLVRRRR